MLDRSRHDGQLLAWGQLRVVVHDNPQCFTDSKISYHWLVLKSALICMIWWEKDIVHGEPGRDWRGCTLRRIRLYGNFGRRWPWSKQWDHLRETYLVHFVAWRSARVCRVGEGGMGYETDACTTFYTQSMTALMVIRTLTVVDFHKLVLWSTPMWPSQMSIDFRMPSYRQPHTLWLVLSHCGHTFLTPYPQIVWFLCLSIHVGVGDSAFQVCWQGYHSLCSTDVRTPTIFCTQDLSSPEISYWNELCDANVEYSLTREKIINFIHIKSQSDTVFTDELYHSTDYYPLVTSCPFLALAPPLTLFSFSFQHF